MICKSVFCCCVFLTACILSWPVFAAASPEPAEINDESSEQYQGQVEEIVITGHRPYTASSDQTLRDQDFRLFPKRTASDLMRLIPGLHITQHTGGAKAHQIFLRGFDAEHGQEIAACLDGIPLNEVSHVHGQGYLDLHFLIPEVIHRIKISKGPYDAREGNFSTGGTIHFTTDPHLQEPTRLRFGIGSFGSRSGLAEFTLGSSNHQAYLALQGERSDGFTKPGQLQALRAFARFRADLYGDWRADVLYAGYQARSQAADTLPKNLIDNGSIDRFESLDPSNRVDVDRHLGGLIFSGPFADGNLQATGYYNFKDTRIFSNYTYFYFNTENGDQLEQSDRRHYGGLKAAYQRNDSLDGIGELETDLGIQWRLDKVWQTQANTKARVRMNVLNDYAFTEHNLGAYAQERLLLGKKWMLVAGIRYDANLIELGGFQDMRELDIVTNQVVVHDDQPRDASAFAQAVSPKLSIVFSPTLVWKLFANFGRGFVTRPARDQTDRPYGTTNTITGAELASSLDLLDDRLHIVTSLWWAHKDSELIFDPEFGQSVFRGQSHRLGTELEVRLSLAEWIWLAVDLFYTHARLQNQPGDWKPIPNTPALLMTNLLAFDHPSGIQASLRGRLIGKRQHDLGLSSASTYLLDLVVAWETEYKILSLEIQNLGNVAWYDSVFAYPVRSAPEAPVDQGLQVTAGTPFAAQFFLTFKL